MFIDPPHPYEFDPLDLRVGADDAIVEALLQQFDDEDSIAGQHIQNPDQLAQHFRNVIGIGAAAERVILHNRCLTTGGPVDVVLVDDTGAMRL